MYYRVYLRLTQYISTGGGSVHPPLLSLFLARAMGAIFPYFGYLRSGLTVAQVERYITDEVWEHYLRQTILNFGTRYCVLYRLLSLNLNPCRWTQ